MTTKATILGLLLLFTTLLSATNTNLIPFTEVDGFILIDVVVDGEKSKFILDTGADNLYINTKIKGQFVETFSTAKEDVTLEGSVISELKMGSKTWTILPAYHIDLSNIADQFDFAIGGILGINFVLPDNVIIDYSNKLIRVNYPLEEYVEKNNFKLAGKVKFKYLDLSIPIVEFKVNGQLLHFGIDSGTSCNVIFNKEFIKTVNKEKLRKNKYKVHFPNGTSAHFKRIDNVETSLENIEIKNLSFLYKREFNSHLDGLVNLNLLGFDKYIIDTETMQIFLYTQSPDTKS